MTQGFPFCVGLPEHGLPAHTRKHVQRFANVAGDLRNLGTAWDVIAETNKVRPQATRTPGSLLGYKHVRR